MTDPVFDADTLASLRDLREVRIETLGPKGEPHRAIIWVVVDESDRVMIRSWRGAGARWYREAQAAGRATLVFDGTTLPVRVEVATDAARIEAAAGSCSRSTPAIQPPNPWSATRCSTRPSSCVRADGLRYPYEPWTTPIPSSR